MAMKVCVLASGSSGNCTYVAGDHAAILLDAGLSAREVGRRLEQVGARLDQIHAVCISHEHADHTAGIRVLHKRYGIPVFANSGTVQALQRDERAAGVNWQVFSTGSAFSVGDLSVEPFSVPHDAMDPVGFVIGCGATRVGVVTDVGMATTLLRERLSRCRVVVMESNHDERMLENSKRPWYLKQRIKGRQGHLSNARAAEVMAEVAGSDLQHVFLAHISEECNRHELALRAAEDKLRHAGCPHVKVSLTYPDRISDIWDERLFAASDPLHPSLQSASCRA